MIQLAEADLDPYEPGGDEVYHFAWEAVEWPKVVPVGGTFGVKAHVWDCR